MRLSARVVQGKTEKSHGPIMVHESLPTPTESAFGSHPRRVFSVCYELPSPFHGDTSNPQRPTSIVKFLGPPRPAPTTPLASFVSREPESGNIVSGVFTPVLAKHSKSFSSHRLHFSW